MLLDKILEALQSQSNKLAYVINDKKYTYKEYYKYVCNIYHYLLSNNFKNKTVIIYGHKNVYMKASFLACSFAGITYVPIDVSMPKERVESIIKLLKPSLIIGDFETAFVKNISEDEIIKIMNKEDYKYINEIYLKSEDVYYIIFTSGSTGIPKGVQVTYENLNSCVNWLNEIIKVQKGVILNQAIFSFDLSVADLYLSLVTESTHFILEKNVQSNFLKLFENLNQSKAEVAVLTPSFADLLLLDKSFNEELMPNLHTIIFCGEKLMTKTIEKIYSRFKKLKIINSYGPTECTFAVTSLEISRDINTEEEIPIGVPKKGVEIFIVNENFEKVEDNELGEIIITGDSVAKGYVGNINSNAFITYEGKKGYSTGDIGYLKNGKLYYKCRKDKQIKYKGYRIELSDIEKNLSDLEYIEKAVVVAKYKEQTNIVNKILAFVSLKNGIEKDINQIKKDLLKKLPEYMCPIIKIVETFPINKNGKCDEKKLLEENC